MTRVVVPKLDSPPARPAGGDVVSLAGEALGTTWSVKAVAAPSAAPTLRAAVDAALAEAVAAISAWNPASDLCRYNTAPPGSWVPLHPMLLEVLALALEVAEASGGAYDPTVGALTDLWGFGPGPARVAPPSEVEIAAAMQGVAWRRLRLDATRGAALQPGAALLDVSSIGKGHVVDLVSARLTGLGAQSHLVEIGGELRGEGIRPDGQPWWAAVEAPPGADIAPMRAALFGLSVATSGDYRRFFGHGGRAYAHTLDPRTGHPVRHGLASVTVFHRSAAAADAHATAMMVLGPEEGLTYAERLGLAALFVERTGTGWQDRLSRELQALAD